MGIDIDGQDLRGNRFLGLIGKVRAIIGADRPIIFAVLNQLIGAIGMVGSLYCAGAYFSSEERGFYFTFSSLIAIQQVLEAGFGQCIVQFASHEFARLRFANYQEVHGDPVARDRLYSLGRLAAKWYVKLAVGFFFVSLGGGYLFFSAKSSIGVSWAWGWAVLCLATSLNILTLPYWYLLEGCIQVSWVNGTRAVGNAVKSAALCVGIISGFGLMSAGLAAFLYSFVTIAILLVRWRLFLRAIWKTEIAHSVSWKEEIWPFQWRIATSWLGGYLSFNLANPMIFGICGPVEAGRFGMAWAAAQGIGNFAMSWGATKIPRYGMLVAQRSYRELDKLWNSALVRSIGVSILGSGILVALLLSLEGLPKYRDRFPPLWQVIVLLLGVVLNQVLFAQAFFLRAHKREPFLILSLVNGGLIAGGVALGAYLIGTAGVVLANSIVSVAMVVWGTWIYTKFRHQYVPAS